MLWPLPPSTGKKFRIDFSKSAFSRCRPAAVSSVRIGPANFYAARRGINAPEYLERITEEAVY